MFSVVRDGDGRITGISREEIPGAERLDAHHPDILHFLDRPPDQEIFSDADADFVRVIEDVIDALIHNNVIKLTDLPPAAQKKLLLRKGIRNKLSGALDLLGNDDLIL